MTIVSELVATLSLDDSKFKSGIDNAISKSSNLVGGLSKIGGGLVLGAVGAATAGIVGLGAVLISSTSAAMEAENIQAQLNAVLKSTGGVSGMTAKSVNDLATSLSKVTPFEDDVIVSGENMLLTFTNIGKEVFPQATETMLDMSQALGQDLNTSAIQLGKALNNPIEGISALSRVGVTFTDDQKKMIETMVKAGDVAGAQSVILQELQKEFGGSAKAAGQTFSGQLTILKNNLGNIKESIGNAVLPTLSKLATMFNDYLSRPETIAFIQVLAEKIAQFAQVVVSYIPVVIDWFMKIATWFMNHKEVIVGILAALGVAVGTFIYTTVAGLITLAGTFLATFGPAIAIMAAVGLAVGLLYKAWTTNFMGIQDKVKAVWAFLKPIFESIKQWLQTNIPVAIQALTNYWNNVLMPAIQKVWNFIKTYLVPLFTALAGVVGTILKLAFQALVGFIQNVVVPAFSTLWSFIQDNVIPIISSVANWISEHLTPAFAGLKDIISKVIEWLMKLQDWLDNLTLPDWLTPGSPTPLEMGIRGIKDALMDLSRTQLPDFSANVKTSMVNGSLGMGGLNLYNYGTITIPAEGDVAQSIIKQLRK